jgi:hypothetical protein
MKIRKETIDLKVIPLTKKNQNFLDIKYNSFEKQD